MKKLTEPWKTYLKRVNEYFKLPVSERMGGTGGLMVFLDKEQAKNPVGTRGLPYPKKFDEYST